MWCPKARRDWSNLLIEGDFLMQNPETRIHTILGKTESARCAVPFKLRELADELEAGKIPKT